jgi:uncharacterized protein involved in cysteine biosynthesis
MITRFANGFLIPFRGAHYIRQNKFIWPYLIAPMIATLIFSLGLFFAMLEGFPAIMSLLGLNQLLPAFYYSLWVLLLLGFLIIGGLVGVFASRIFAFPLYALISEKIFIQEGTLTLPSSGVADWTKRLVVLTRASIGKSVLLCIAAIVLFVCAFLPILDMAVGLSASFLLAIDCLDTPLELLHPRLKTRTQYWTYFAPELFGMTCALAVGLTIPGLSFILIPSAIVGNCLLLTQARETKGAHVTRTDS